MAYQLTLQGRDASVIPLVCRDPVLSQHQQNIEANMQPNEALLNALFFFRCD